MRTEYPSCSGVKRHRCLRENDTLARLCVAVGGCDYAPFVGPQYEIGVLTDRAGYDVLREQALGTHDLAPASADRSSMEWRGLRTRYAGADVRQGNRLGARLDGIQLHIFDECLRLFSTVVPCVSQRIAHSQLVVRCENKQLRVRRQGF